MSTLDDEIKRHCRDGRLTPVDFPPDERFVYVSQVIDQAITHDDEASTDILLALHRFVRGDRMRVRRPGVYVDGDEQSDLVLLDPKGTYPEKIWELRVFDADPQFRIFGCFSKEDHFVALTLEERDGLDFGQAMVDCENAWNGLFPGFTPPDGKGAFPNGYVSDAKLVPS